MMLVSRQPLDSTDMRTSNVLLLLGLAAAVGLSVSGYFVWRAVTIEQAEPRQALQEFTAIRNSLGTTEPMLRVDESGQVVRGTTTMVKGEGRPSKLKVLAYQAGEQRLARASIPIWFYKLKGSAVQFALRGTEIDLKRLGITAGDLERHGPGLVFDETRSNGDRLLVWTE